MDMSVQRVDATVQALHEHQMALRLLGKAQPRVEWVRRCTHERGGVAHMHVYESGGVLLTMYMFKRKPQKECRYCQGKAQRTFNVAVGGHVFTWAELQALTDSGWRVFYGSEVDPWTVEAKGVRVQGVEWEGQ